MIRLESGRTYVWQWDTKQRVELTDFLPGTEVHFSNCNSETAPVVKSYADGDKVVANIPVLLMQEALDITVFACDEYNTKHCSFISVITRPRPDDYVYEEVDIVRYADLAKRIPFDVSYEGQLLYVVGGVAMPLRLGPGLSIKNGVLYVSGSTDEPDTPVEVVVTATVVDGVEVLVDSGGQIVTQLTNGAEVITDPTGSVAASITDGVETISVKEVT